MSGVEGRETVRDRVDRGANIVPLVKAMFLGEDGSQQSAAMIEVEEVNTAFASTGAVEPPYDPRVMSLIYENSSALRPNIDSYITNIDSYGHTFKPVINLDAPDADTKLAHAIRMEKRVGKKLGPEPSADEINARKDTLRDEMLAEADQLSIFFENCAGGLPFSGPEGLRGLTRLDLEVTGNAYWEVLRNDLDEVAGFNRLPAVSMRFKPLDPMPVPVKDRRRRSLLSFAEVEVNKRFRRFVQRYEGNTQMVHFKEFGDPRVVSTKTGKAYQDIEAMQQVPEEEGAAEATEVIHFRITSPRSTYGIPRWVGVLLAVLGSRQAEEVNFLYFENRSVPPLAILVSGGRLNEDSTKRLEDWIGNNIRGKRNFHKILILEAEGANAPGSAADPDTGRMKIQLQPLTDAQQKDGLFLDYDERNADKVGQSFRLPRLLRGDVRDFNRSTAEASVDFAEIQVFGPIRQQFDWSMNQIVLSALGISYHEFVSNAPTVRDPVNLAKMITELVMASVLTPGEGRELAQGVFNRPFLKIDADWTNQPIAITVSGRNMPGPDQAGTTEGKLPDAGAMEPNGQGVSAGPMSVPGAAATQEALGVTNKAVPMAAIINKLHAHMIAQERAEYAAMERETIKVPADIFYSFFANVPA